MQRHSFHKLSPVSVKLSLCACALLVALPSLALADSTWCQGKRKTTQYGNGAGIDSDGTIASNSDCKDKKSLDGDASTLDFERGQLSAILRKLEQDASHYLKQDKRAKELWRDGLD